MLYTMGPCYPDGTFKIERRGLNIRLLTSSLKLSRPTLRFRERNPSRQGMCPQAVAENMCELAYRMGTSDNVTVVVVQFHHFRLL